MDFRKAVEDACISVELESTNKDEVVEELIDMLCAAGKIPDREAALRAVREREAKMSTGMQFGVAIPHGKTETIDRMVTAIGLKKDGIDFDALDGEPSRIFVMTVSPVREVGPHIEYLSEISRLLNASEYRKRLLASRTPDDMIAVLTGE